MVNKKAYIRTLEALVAVLIVFLFISFVVPKHSVSEARQENINLLEKLKDNPDFRYYIYENNETSAKGFLNDYVPNRYNFDLSIYGDANYSKTDLPDKDIYVEYEDGHILRRILIESGEEYSLIGYFEPGETDWELKDGEDKFFGSQLDLYEFDQESNQWIKRN